MLFMCCLALELEMHLFQLFPQLVRLEIIDFKREQNRK